MTGQDVVNRLRWVWKGMRQRCNNPNNPAYKNYGGRGIEVCREWDTFAGFMKDMARTYQVGLMIDRIDNDGNYCAENCRWTTRKVQNENKRSNVRYEIDGERLLLREVAEKYNIPYKRLKARIERLKMPLDYAIQLGRNDSKGYYYSIGS